VDLYDISFLEYVSRLHGLAVEQTRPPDSGEFQAFGNIFVDHPGQFAYCGASW
jgi:hypothetical protein